MDAYALLLCDITYDLVAEYRVAALGDMRNKRIKSVDYNCIVTLCTSC